ncbi:hypothetical protein HOLleu_08478 [Holothuria leucospilota]|uniref:Uncharacterized protein n=1 Tax=Holothuria leucospilota TaxID=206669 RepID=A0A9Q1HHX0_HOLLE|nr:hypothetical protein HOLleu_08478 [Holothuria leucospilota]
MHLIMDYQGDGRPFKKNGVFSASLAHIDRRCLTHFFMHGVTVISPSAHVLPFSRSVGPLSSVQAIVGDKLLATHDLLTWMQFNVIPRTGRSCEVIIFCYAWCAPGQIATPCLEFWGDPYKYFGNPRKDRDSQLEYVTMGRLKNLVLHIVYRLTWHLSPNFKSNTNDERLLGAKKDESTVS